MHIQVRLRGLRWHAIRHGVAAGRGMKNQVCRGRGGDQFGSPALAPGKMEVGRGVRAPKLGAASLNEGVAHPCTPEPRRQQKGAAQHEHEQAAIQRGGTMYLQWRIQPLPARRHRPPRPLPAGKTRRVARPRRAAEAWTRPRACCLTGMCSSFPPGQPEGRKKPEWRPCLRGGTVCPG